ncbi:hypothetical protein KMW28_23940 [Flammeovirga yaeyamensis]|uniref:Uncharacterized protein n=1 Tax=Flammeovirga yaeyamensis TaxID=367791 RepID=A0AAX1ND47_9BACT|nr:hypothetical protein [Flammeovirga yaeyamensis]MBB3696569.1 hypothetical protein [Flammeovirga yaeyamensis]NMF33247.1 hypothetical protein [Flammeovirga yaeyamensis]QWG05474.1 hypothetical protein KMW28_23940 [Flammeovirga yaeyamensis]
MKWIKNIEDFTEHIFSTKERAAKRHLNSKNAEKPREVFERTCQLIADELKDIGFTYYPSQHKLKLESADKKYILFINFSSNRDNVAGQYVELSAVFYIESKDLKKYSKNHPLLNYWNETMIGRDIGSLVKGGEGNIIWNLADKNDFENAVLIIPQTTKENLISVFEDFQDSEIIAKEIERDNFELNNPMTTVQYLLMLNKQSIAEKYLSTFLTRKPEKILEDYKKAVEQFKNEGIPSEFIHGMGYGYEVALLETEYELKIKVPNIN